MSRKCRQEHPREPRLFITEAELAERWRHSLRSMQRWRAGGSGPKYTRIGRRIVFRISDVEAFEAEREGDE